jgi:GH18 family chitinase
MQKGEKFSGKVKTRIGILLAMLLVINLGLVPSLAADTEENTARDNQFKVIGYYSGSLFNEPIEKLQTDKLTHIIYAFLIPQEDGSLVALEKPDQLKELVEQAHNDGAKVFIALGGWSYQGKPLVTVFESVAASDAKRALLVKNVCALVKEYELDGVELDWEHPNQSSIGNYEKLVVDLKAALDKDGKDLTAALNGAWSTTAGPEVSKLMTDVCLESFRFINVMAYDMNNAEHSPLWFADTSINYWLNRGVPTEKIILGMPLYARPSWKQYRHLVAENPEYAYLDHVADATLESYYNGLNTLREKTYIAMKKAGGVMLFDVNEDTDDETSIVSMIQDLKNRTEGYSKEELKQSVFVLLNNRELVFLKEEGYGVPFIDDNNRTMIPFRKPIEAIGASVSYDENNRVVSAVKDNITVKLTIGESEISVNGQEVVMDTKAVIKDGRTYIPLRAVFSAFGYDAAWHSSSNTVYITERNQI